MSYHPLHSYGQIGIKDIHREKGHCGLTSDPVAPNIFTLRELARGTSEGGDGVALNPYNPTSILARIQKLPPYGNTPYRISDWYGYNHNATVYQTHEDQYFPAAYLFLHQLSNSAYVDRLHADSLSRLDLRIENAYIAAKENNQSVNPSTPNYPVTYGEVRVHYQVNRISSLLSRASCIVARTVIKINLAAFQPSPKQIDIATITLLGESSYNEPLALVLVTYDPDNQISIYDWSDFSGCASDTVGFNSNGEMVFTLTGIGKGHIASCYNNRADRCAYFEVLSFDYDYEYKIHRGDELISANNSSMAYPNAWFKFPSALVPAGSTFNVDLLTQDNRDVLRLQFIDNSPGEQTGSLCAILSKGDISGWSSGDPLYTDTVSGETVRRYTILFDYIWPGGPVQEDFVPPWWIYRSHIHLNGDHMGCMPILGNTGIFEADQTYDAVQRWAQAQYSEDIPVQGANINEQGVAIYIAYEDFDRAFCNHTLLIDNFHLYKTYYIKNMFCTVSFRAISAPLFIKYFVPDWPGSLLITSITSITTSSGQVGVFNISDGGSSLIEIGLVWRAVVSPTYSVFSGKYAKTPVNTQSFNYTMQGLIQGTVYKVRAYLKNWSTENGGISYSNEQTFQTPGGPA